MGVPVHDYVRLILRQQPLWRWAAQLVSVADVDAKTADRSFDGLLQPGIIGWISVSEYGIDWGDGRELLENAVAHVAGVKDQLDALENGEHIRPNEAVRVGDQADEMCVVGHYRRRRVLEVSCSPPPRQRRTSACSIPR